MLLLPRKAGLESLLKEVRVFKVGARLGRGQVTTHSSKKSCQKVLENASKKGSQKGS